MNLRLLIGLAGKPRWGELRPLVALLLVPAILASTMPASGQMQTRHPASRAPDLPDDVLLGLQIAVTLSETIGLVEDQAWRGRLDRIGYRVAAVADDEETPYSFDILDLPEPNALALPGGFLFVTRGMMEIDLSDDELAHLIGHEISHVRQGHFQRASQLSGLLSLVNTALLIGILVSAEPGTSRERIERMDDPGLKEWSVGVTGRDALIQGVSLFGNVLSALFARSYSRKLEFEADETGQRLATRAGFDPSGGPGLLETLHDRSYDRHHLGYWRTHPYFDDRIVRARALAQRLSPSSAPRDDSAYREHWALFFAEAAQDFPGDREAVYLYERALRCAQAGLATLTGGLEMVRFKKRREERQHELRRGYQTLITAYDEIIARAEQESPDWSSLGAARSEREEIIRQKAKALPDYIEVLDGENVATDMLERFVENYPTHPRVFEVTYRLAEHYRLTDRPAAAIDALARLQPSEARVDSVGWADSTRTAMIDLVTELGDLALCRHLMLRGETAGAGDTAVAAAAQARIEELVEREISLEEAGRYLRDHPESPWSERIRQQSDLRAREAFQAGRVHEGLQRYQDALDAYFSVVAWAPDAGAADEAAEAIERINRLETLDLR